MALKSNRVGVRIDQVDDYGRVISKSFLQSLIDHLPRWTSLKVWKNGTEQLLPVNTDEPVTSPIVADIQYPTDSSATEHMFTYRKSPTDVDGEAYIQSIKGNTIKWNQLQPIQGLTETVNDVTFTNNNDGSWTVNGTASAQARNNLGSLSVPLNHIVFMVGCPSGGSISSYSLLDNLQSGNKYDIGGGIIYAVTNTSNTVSLKINVASGVTANNLVFRPQLFDLTAMLGPTKANEILAMETAQAGSGVAYFKSLFPLPYYKYDAGSLLSFNGTGIKTIGKNQVALPVVAYNTLYDLPLSGYFPILKGTYTLSYTANKNHRYIIKLVDANGNYLNDNVYKPNTNVYWSDPYQGWFLGADRTAGSFTFPVNIVEDCYIRIGRCFTNPDTIELTNVQLEVGSTATSYEPYTTSTTIIPTDTYFPTGMKSFGEYYDEFTSSRAYTRVQQYDFTGSETWNFFDTFFATTLNVTRKDGGDVITSNGITLYVYASGNVRCYLSNNSQITSETDMTSVLSDGVAFVCELAEEIIEPTLTFDEE